VNGAEATDDARLKELRAYADADYLYVRLTATKETPFGANYLDFFFTDGEGETSVWWGWTTTGTDIYYQEHKCELDAETGALTKMRWYPVEGDRVYIYTGAGQLVCDTTALSATEVVRENGKVKQVVNTARLARCRQVNPTLPDSSCVTYYYSITIDSAAVNFDALVGYNLTLQTADDQHKVLVDNMSMASNGFLFDNCLSQNIRSRGLLIKASEGKIVNCTFRNIGMACAAILYEIYWGESGVSENLTVSRNVMDHIGYFTKYTSGNEDRYSPISIEGLGSRVEEDYLLYKNIEITDNIIRNRTTDYAIYVNSARDVIIKGNDFGDRAGGEDPEHPTLAIHLNGAMNIEISDNKYSSLDLPIEEKIKVQHIKHIFGSDVEYNGEPIIPDKE
jgi:hypothetical protein